MGGVARKVGEVDEDEAPPSVVLERISAERWDLGRGTMRNWYMELVYGIGIWNSVSLQTL